MTSTKSSLGFHPKAPALPALKSLEVLGPRRIGTPSGPGATRPLGLGSRPGETAESLGVFRLLDTDLFGKLQVKTNRLFFSKLFSRKIG
jgi:hypothetical protein